MRLKTPNYPAINSFGTWDLYQLPRAKQGSPLWIELKLMTRAQVRQWGRRRVFRLCWGVDARRLRRGADHVLLEEQEPDLYEAVVRFLAGFYTPERLAASIGATALAAERVRIATAAERRKLERAFRRAMR
jgi:hypothetical protein